MRANFIKLIKNKPFLLLILIFIVIPTLIDIINILSHQNLDIILSNTSMDTEELKKEYALNEVKDLVASNSLNIYYVVFIFLPLALVDDFKNNFNYLVLKNKVSYFLNKLFTLFITTIIMLCLVFLIDFLILSLSVNDIVSYFKLVYHENYFEIFFVNSCYNIIMLFVISISFFIAINCVKNIVLNYFLFVLIGYFISDNIIVCIILIILCFIIFIKGRLFNDRVW